MIADPAAQETTIDETSQSESADIPEISSNETHQTEIVYVPDMPYSDTTQAENIKTEFAMGETWTVDGQWTLTVTDVKKTDERNEFSDYSPAAVYIVSYRYENIGYEDESGLMDGLFFGMSEGIVDSSGKMGYEYPGDVTRYPQETPVGAHCEAQSCVGVDNEGAFKIHVTNFDGKGNEQKATFVIVP